MRKLVIAIDGPAASGKSTTARLVARRLGYLHIDTGAMYRAITLKVLRLGVDPHDKAGVEDCAQTTSIRLIQGTDGNTVILDGEDVSDRIREPAVTKAVSLISSYPGVREVMVREQRSAAKEGGVVLEGRDIGTVVLPQADVKCFLVAEDHERARRRKKELARSGVDVKEDVLLEEIRNRDRQDSTRTTSPLRRATDAVEIDTTALTVEQQVDRILREVEKVSGKK